MNGSKSYVIPVPGHEDEIATIKTHIESCGGTIICEDDSIDNYEHCVGEADVVVVLMCVATKDNDLIDKIIGFANKLGKRIVGIWSSNANQSTMPMAIHRYGDAVISLNAGDISASVCHTENPWHTPEGRPRNPPKTPRHKKR